MTIDELVAAFAALPGAVVGKGPHHPATPDPALAPELTELFETYPGLSSDAGYVELLWKYGGLSRRDDDDNELFHVFGFGPDVVDFYRDLDGPGVDELAFFIFAQAVVHAGSAGSPEVQERAFGFDLSGNLKPGVYVFESTLNAEAQTWIRYADDFTAFLADAVKRGGVWPRPDL